MDITTCINLLGASSIYPQLDFYMLSNGIKKRPQDKGGIEHLNTPNDSVFLGFRERHNYETEALLPIKSDGKYILCEIVVYPENKGALPYKLNFNDKIQSLREKLGKEVKDNKNALPERRVVTFFHDSLIIVIFMDAAENISTMKFIVPNIYHKQNLGISL